MWVAGDDGFVLHLDGGLWRVIPAGTTASLAGIWAFADPDEARQPELVNQPPPMTYTPDAPVAGLPRGWTDPNGCRPSWDGDYVADVTTVTPAGPTEGQGTFSCLAGYCEDPGGTFTGVVAADGQFTGQTIVCDTCEPLAMSGVFHPSDPFTISGVEGQVSQTIVAQRQP